MDNLLIFQTGFWRATHRSDSRYPGYLIASSIADGAELGDLCERSLRELGGVLSKAEAILRRAFSPYKVMVAKLGFSKGFRCHFHLIPATAALMDEIVAHPAYSDEPDGNDALLFVSREFCERALTNEEKSEMEQTVARLRENS